MGSERESDPSSGAGAPGGGEQVPGPDPGLTFPDVPRLALDELIGQLTDRAQDVLAAQGRLRGLLRANAVIAGELSLPVVLRHVVQAARDLVRARYGALGVIGPDGRLEQFVHVGMDPDQVDRIGHLPTGQGLLGALIHRPGPVRLTNLRTHPGAAGFPDQHPPMTSFLGVPIRVHGQVYGNLYLTDSANGEFTAEDEQLVTALAGTAGTAIANARLHQEAVDQRRWLDASSKLTQHLFARTAEAPLDALVRFAMQAAAADMASFTAPVSEHTARVQAAAGALTDRVGEVVNLDRTLVGRVIRSGKPVLVGHYAAEFDTENLGDLPDGIGAVIAVPVHGPDRSVRGALVVGHTENLAYFTMNDRDHLARFAGQAGVALELEDARREQETLRQLEDRERIAADLHDHVIQELFATGMGLQSMVTGLTRADQQARVLGYIDTLDNTIRNIRNTIYRLQRQPETLTALRKRLLAVLAEQTASTDLSTRIDFTGSLDDLPEDLGDDAVAVLREALTNTVRHANASTVDVQITRTDQLLILEVTDNGAGIGHPTRSSGLTNMRRRATAHGGTLHLHTPPGGGTRLTWTATS